MLHFLYHYIYQDFYIPVWPNIAASIVVAIWVVGRVRLHLTRHHETMHKMISMHTQLMRNELNAHLSELRPTIHHSPDSSDISEPIFSRQEARETNSGNH